MLVEATLAAHLANVHLLSMSVNEGATALLVTHIWYFGALTFIFASAAFAYTTTATPPGLTRTIEIFILDEHAPFDICFKQLH